MSPPPNPLAEEDRRILLQLARRAIVENVCHGRIPELPATGGRLLEKHGVFVTLHRRGQLRGCIGQISPDHPLAEAVVECSILAARQDPRFAPVQPEEVSELEIEISILSDLEPARPDQVEIGRHGLVVALGGLRGLLLPQVPVEHGWDRQRFLEETCGKAGLPANAWSDPAAQLFVFTAGVFSERDTIMPRQGIAG